MSGDWLTFGVVGLIAAAGAARGSRNREPDNRVRNIVLAHPDGAEVVAYLRHPSLRKWREIRGMLIPGTSGMGRTLWQAVTWFSWWEETGLYERPPFSWMQQDQRAYPDQYRCYPPPVVLEKAVLMVLGMPAFVEAGPTEALCADRPEPQEFEAPVFSGPPVVLYRGEGPTGPYWASRPTDVGIQVLLITRRRKGLPSLVGVWVAEHGEEPHILTWQDDKGSTVFTTGVGVEDAVANAWRRHQIDLDLSYDYHWDEQGHLRPGPR